MFNYVFIYFFLCYLSSILIIDVAFIYLCSLNGILKLGIYLALFIYLFKEYSSIIYLSLKLYHEYMNK